MEGSVLICDYAQVNGGKLYATGAAVNLLFTQDVDPPHLISAVAAVVVSVPWQAHNQLHKMTVSLIDEDGRRIPIAAAVQGAQVDPDDEGSLVARFNAGRSPVMNPGDESLIPMAVPLGVRVPHLGVYRLSLSVDGTELAAARFRVLIP